MSSTSRLAQKYRNIRFLPRREFLLVESLLIGVVSGILVYSIAGGINWSFTGFLDGLISLTFGSIMSATILFMTAKEGVLTFKRLMAMVNIGILLLGVGLIVSAISANLSSDIYLFEKGYFISCGILTAYVFVILAAMINKRTYKLFFLAILLPVMVISLHIITLIITSNIYLFDVNLLIAFIVMVVFSFLAARWYFASIAKVGKELLGLSGILILHAFIEALVLDKTGLLEMVLKSISEEDDVEIKTYYFVNRDQKGMIVAPFFHPGPFRNIGSSRMPTRIATEFLKNNILPIVFHTPTTHEKDLILKKDCDRVMKAIFSTNYDEGASIASPIIVEKSGNITVTAQIFDETPLVVISRSPLPTEDLPEAVNLICMKKLAEKGYSDGVIVDAHNSMVANFTDLSEEDNQNILKALEGGIEKAKSYGQGAIKAGFSNIHLKEYSIKDGIGDAGVMAMVTEVSGEKGVFVSIDGNNMIVGLRDKIKEELQGHGFNQVEITTTDTHVVTGHTAGEGYFPLGVAIPESYLIEKVLEAVIEADSKKTECSVKFSKRKVEHVNLLGNRGLENLWKVTNDSIRVAKRRLIVLVLLLITVGSLLYLII